MQYDLEHGMPVSSIHNSYTAKREPLPMDKDHAQMEQLGEEQYPHKPKNIDGLEERTQELPVEGLQGIRQSERFSPKVWNLILMIGDGILLVSLLALVSMLTPHFHLKLIWISLALILWTIAVKITKAQELVNASSGFKSLLYALFAVMLMLIFWIMLTYAFIINDPSYTKVLLLFLVLAIPVFGTWRLAFAKGMSLPRFRHLAVIVGVNSAGQAIAKELRSAKHPNSTVLGYIGESSTEKLNLDGLPILGGRSMLRYLVHNGMIDMIIIALDYKANPQLFKEAIEAAQLGIAVLPMTVVYESSAGKVPVEHIGDQWYAVLQSERILSPLYICWKKALDLVSGFCGLLVLCPVLPVIALLIYLDSPGPIFYSQERVGFRGKSFRIYKFRSMYTDAEAEGRPQWATEHDKRVTRVGRFLRATHLDELPQLFNVLRGDMSLIGPRPERAEFVTELEKTVPFYRYRLAVKPGLTGWAQVKYHYARTDDDAVIKLQYDLYYVKRQSFMLDLFIILKTVAEVLSLRGS